MSQHHTDHQGLAAANHAWGDQRPPVRGCRIARGRGGYALLIVLVVILTTTALAAVHQRQLSAALRLEQARIHSETHSRGPLTVLAIAIDLMKTGDPPAPIDYRYDHTIGAEVTLYRVSYAVSGTQWTVTAEPDPTASALSALPASF